MNRCGRGGPSPLISVPRLVKGVGEGGGGEEAKSGYAAETCPPAVSAGGRGQEFCHGEGCPLLDVVGPIVFVVVHAFRPTFHWLLGDCL